MSDKQIQAWIDKFAKVSDADKASIAANLLDSIEGSKKNHRVFWDQLNEENREDLLARMDEWSKE